jgi:hypothetical protein
MNRPEDVRLSREEGEALIERIERNALNAEDRQLLVKIVTFYFWLLFALREAKLSLKRLKALVFGEKPKKSMPPSSVGAAGGGSRREGNAAKRITRRAPLCVFAGVSAESAIGAWATGGRRVLGGADGRVSPRGVSRRRALSGVYIAYRRA